ncbi:hypothetical protein [Candidatus Enterococcus clewellii]|uniref:Uncharacterized protein n=1 Tax=Candidatus Enterococcus clewellii TaxID=1834193 RepID=A0A242KFU0_9ENTE|nr:hypothetical protein [Enterococcus sp. 9E7_DIV0242]OTP19410.1 hypothetical protein A5888_001227 [Enterococcus sp. 9E7_DIV0242]
MVIKNRIFTLNVTEQGTVDLLQMNADPYRMNWVITEDYLNEVDYYSKDKLFGNFIIKIEDKIYNSAYLKPEIERQEERLSIQYDFNDFQLLQVFDLSDSEVIRWSIEFINERSLPLKLQEFSVWIPFSYIMFRDPSIRRNVHQSAAVFPSLSPDFSKIAVMRRSSEDSSLGMYQLAGEILSVGSYCEFQNKFFEDISPSLDGLIYHKMILSGKNRSNEKDWVYPGKEVIVEAGGSKIWQYQLNEVADQQDFFTQGQELGHPKIDFPERIPVGEAFDIRISGSVVVRAMIEWQADGKLQRKELSVSDGKLVSGIAELCGEHRLVVEFADGKKDQLILNVMEDIRKVVEERVSYLCEHSYGVEEAHAFSPVSNQGESLGKLSLILKKNLLAEPKPEEIHMVERSINQYVMNKWFDHGDFKKPRNIYGSFYRVMDFEYLGHVLYLLSLFPDQLLHEQRADTYLTWAAQVVELRINPECHDSLRAKEESEMLGVFFLYINELIEQLEQRAIGDHTKLKSLWENNLFEILEDKTSLKAVMTEHYFDNAGFGPAAAALANAGYTTNCLRYGELLLANIGFSNDFRAQNPDRWWEALAYMIHSLWGGITAAAALDVFHAVKDPRYLEASYRAFVGVLYCYDHHSTTTTKIQAGEAVSTYAVTSPHDNRVDLSRNRFGQETFAKDGGIFAQIFDENSQQTSDWDMGEELVAYLDRFGQNAYVYYDEEQTLKVVNGKIEARDKERIITSYAPYPKNILFLTGGELQRLEGDGKKAILSRQLESGSDRGNSESS